MGWTSLCCKDTETRWTLSRMPSDWRSEIGGQDGVKLEHVVVRVAVIGIKARAVQEGFENLMSLGGPWGAGQMERRRRRKKNPKHVPGENRKRADERGKGRSQQRAQCGARGADGEANSITGAV